MQLSGPWPPYHFVHRLTRSAHPQTHSTAATAQPAVPVDTTVIPILEPSAVLA
jgi:hypothetical protein